MGQHGFCVDGGHAQESDDPHPEDGAGAADQDSAGSTYDVAGTYLCGDGRGQSLEGAHAAALLTALEGQIAEDVFHAFAKAANLDELGLDGEPEAAGNEENDEDVVRQIRIDRLHNREQDVVHKFFLL